MKQQHTAHDILKNSRRIIFKLGSSLIIESETGAPKLEWLNSFADDILKLHKQGIEIAIVSSGAIALGRKFLNLDYKTPSKDISLDLKQAAASVGQIHLAQLFQSLFAARALVVSQILLSPKDTEDRESHLNARATFEALFKHKIIPIINENDTTATDEIQFGGNDPLSARVAQMVEAEALFILSTTNGLYTDDPRVNENAEHIPFVESIDRSILEIAKEPLKGISTGGMKSKIESARIAVNAGTHVIIANGLFLNPLSNLQKHTLIYATEKPKAARKKWILAHLTNNFAVVIDDGAAKALQGGKSLLPAGIVEVRGNFETGDALKILNKNGDCIAIGLSNYNASDAQKIKGAKTMDIERILGSLERDELIHRDNLALME